MPRIEKSLSQQKRDQESGQLIVPLIHELLKHNVEIENADDVQFLTALANKQVERDLIRKQGDGVFSPSGLASCLRRVYLSKNWKKLGYERIELPAIEPHYYFMTGDFLHLKWQFLFYKLSLRYPDHFILIDVELPIASKRGDHGGTIDVLALIKNEKGLWELVIIDIKGLNVRGWQKIDEGNISHDYRIQVADYGMLVNSAIQHGKLRLPEELRDRGIVLTKPKVSRGILLAENKGGPDYRHPAALTEHVISIKENTPDVRARLELLRHHEEEETLPEIECVSTRGIQYQGCPFAGVCKEEIKAVERARAKDNDTKEYRVAQPKRSNRSRRSRAK